MIKLMHGYLG